jgi:hypothetical protein
MVMICVRVYFTYDYIRRHTKNTGGGGYNAADSQQQDRYARTISATPQHSSGQHTITHKNSDNAKKKNKTTKTNFRLFKEDTY